MYEIAHFLLFVIILFFFLMPFCVEMLKHKVTENEHTSPTVLCKSNENEFRALFSSKYRRTFRSIFCSFRYN